MAVEWKKVYTTGDQILVTDGGTGVDEIPSGALVGSGNVITAQVLGSNEFLMGVGTAGSEVATEITPPTAFSTTTADVGITGAASGVRKFTLGDGVVTGGANGKMATGTTNWEINEKTIAGNVGGIVAFASAADVLAGTVPIIPDSTTMVSADGQPYVLAPPGNVTQVLKWNGSSLEWGSTGTSSDDLAVTEDNTTATALPISFVRDYSEDDNSPHFINAADLTFTPSTNVMTVGGITLTGTTSVNTVTAAGDATSEDIGFIGTATNATQVTVRNLDGESGSDLEVLIGGGVGTEKKVWSDSGLYYNTDGGTNNSGLLTVPNLKVSGTTTTVNSTVVTISDHIITLAYDADQNAQVTDADVIGAGVALGMSGALNSDGVGLDDELPRLTYLGNGNTNASVSPSKWALTRSEYSGVGLITNVKHGVAIMSNDTISTGSTSMVGANMGTNVGIGAFKICADGGLWIQTSAV